jgi:hypothetical protein
LADLVAVSIVALEPRAAAVEVRALVKALPPGVDLLLGGAQMEAVKPLARCELTALGSLEELERYLVERRSRAARQARRGAPTEGSRAVPPAAARGLSVL